MKLAIRKSLATAALGLAGIAAAGAAQAGSVNWSIGINLPPIGVVGGYYPAPVYYPPPPPVYIPPPQVYYAPPPVYYQPPPVVYAPRPIIYAPPPQVVYAPPPVVYPPPRGYYRHPPPPAYGSGSYQGGYQKRNWQGQGGSSGGNYLQPRGYKGYAYNGDSDRWRDRDGDGVPNRRDRRD